jgi:hypothetical protein
VALAVAAGTEADLGVAELCAVGCGGTVVPAQPAQSDIARIKCAIRRVRIGLEYGTGGLPGSRTLIDY